MGKFINPFTDVGFKRKTDFERWIYLLKHMDTFERMPFKAQKAVFDKLLDIAEVSKLDEKERARYDEALKIYRDYYGTINSAKREGEAKGLAKGLAEGKRLVALNLKQQGLSASVISSCTGLTEDEIAAL